MNVTAEMRDLKRCDMTSIERERESRACFAQLVPDLFLRFINYTDTIAPSSTKESTISRNQDGEPKGASHV